MGLEGLFGVLVPFLGIAVLVKSENPCVKSLDNSATGEWKS